jgi:hypothetical protein
MSTGPSHLSNKDFVWSNKVKMIKRGAVQRIIDSINLAVTISMKASPTLMLPDKNTMVPAK